MTRCEDVRAVAAEVALGLITGSERADVLAHLDACDACRRDVDALAVASDRLVQVAPEAEPPAGFETRVLRRIELSGLPVDVPEGRRRGRWLVAAAAVLAAGALAAAVLAGDGAGSDVASAPMRTDSGRVVGDLHVHAGDPSWVFVTAPGWSKWDGETYMLRADLADGSSVDLGEVDAAVAGRGGWGTTISIDLSQVRRVSVVGDDGRVWCSAELS